LSQLQKTALNLLQKSRQPEQLCGHVFADVVPVAYERPAQALVAIDAAVAAVGLTRVLSYQMPGAMRAGALEVALEAFEPVPWPVSLVHTGQGILPLKLRAFLGFAGPRLKARLADIGV